jgi:hypothetical protein
LLRGLGFGRIDSEPLYRVWVDCHPGLCTSDVHHRKELE